MSARVHLPALCDHGRPGTDVRSQVGLIVVGRGSAVRGGRDRPRRSIRRVIGDRRRRSAVCRSPVRRTTTTPPFRQLAVDAQHCRRRSAACHRSATVDGTGQELIMKETPSIAPPILIRSRCSPISRVEIILRPPKRSMSSPNQPAPATAYSPLISYGHPERTCRSGASTGCRSSSCDGGPRRRSPPKASLSRDLPADR